MPDNPTAPFPVVSTPALRLLGQMAGLLALTCFCSLTMAAVLVCAMSGIRWEIGTREWIGVAQFVPSVGVALWLIGLMDIRLSVGSPMPRRR